MSSQKNLNNKHTVKTVQERKKRIYPYGVRIIKYVCAKNVKTLIQNRKKRESTDNSN